jgi:small-conductance mechanosensitive channel
VADSGVVLTLRYISDPRRRRSTAAAIWEEILTRFAEQDGIDFAYPTTRFYHNRVEGKPGAGGVEPPH